MTLTPDDCADRLDALTHDACFAGRKEDLAELARSIRAEDGDWAGTDLLAAFPSDSSITVDQFDRRERLLSLATLVTVFLPLAWTWWSFQSAVSAYQQNLTPAGSGTFFSQWADGFGGKLAEYHRLAPMALISLGLIGLTVAVAIWHKQRSANVEHLRSRQFTDAQARLHSALMYAQQLSRSQQTAEVAAASRSIKQAVRGLARVHAAAERTAEVLESSSSSLDDSVPSLAKALDQVRLDVQRIIEDGSAKAGTAIVKATEPLTSGASDIAEAAGRLEATVQDLSQAVAATSTIGERIDAFEQVVRRLDLSVSQNASALQAQVSELTRTRAAADGILGELEAQAARLLADATSEG